MLSGELDVLTGVLTLLGALGVTTVRDTLARLGETTHLQHEEWLRTLERQIAENRQAIPQEPDIYEVVKLAIQDWHEEQHDADLLAYADCVPVEDDEDEGEADRTEPEKAVEL